jgi:hypothetical protein
LTDAPKRPGRKPGDPNHHRRGNGSGVQWGGAKRGGVSNSKAGIAGPGRGVTGKTVAELMAAAEAREIAAEAWLAILRDPTHPKHADMVAKAAERMDGAPMQRVQVSAVNPDELTDEELAAIATGRGGAATRAAADQD